VIAVADLRRLAKARLQDAEALFQTRRFDGAVYVVGYSVEIALKARICKTLR
jgi:HEPN domain-containing protein